MRPIWIPAIFVALAGCGSDDTQAPPQPVADAGADVVEEASAESGPDAALTSLSVIVMTSGTDGNPVPASGALVALDRPQGDRVEKTTGADGKASFELDLSSGKAAVTAFVSGNAMLSLVNLDQATVAAFPAAGQTMLLRPLPSDPIPTITVSGTLTNLSQSPTHGVAVNAAHTPAMTEWQGPGDGTFSITAAKGQPFVLQALETEIVSKPFVQGYDMEIHRVAQIDVDASTTDLTGQVIDMAAHEVPTHVADIDFDLPPRTESPLAGGLAACLVCSNNSRACHGWSTHTQVRADKTGFEDSLLWTEPAWADPFYYCPVYAGQAMSFIGILGYPTSGKLPVALLDLPTWLTPADTSVAHALHDKLEWETYDAELSDLGLSIVKNGAQVWFIATPASQSSMTIPKAPTGVDEAQWLGASPSGILIGGTVSADKTTQRYFNAAPILLKAQ